MIVEKSSIKNFLTLAFGAMCISFAPIFVKMIDTTLLGPTAIAFWRTLIGAAILFGLAFVKKEKIIVPKEVFAFALLAGFIFCCDLFVWHKSILFSSAGIATILGNTQVFWMALIGVVFFSEKLSPSYLLSVCMAFVGVMLLVGVGSIQEFSAEYIKGIAFGLMTGIFYSGYITSIKKAGHTKTSFSFISFIAWTSLASALFLAIAMFVESDPYWPPDTNSWVAIIGVAIVAQSVGWYVISITLPKIKASQSGMVLLLQPILATIWGTLFFAERLQALQIAGALLTLVAIYFGSVRKSK